MQVFFLGHTWWQTSPFELVGAMSRSPQICRRKASALLFRKVAMQVSVCNRVWPHQSKPPCRQQRSPEWHLEDCPSLLKMEKHIDLHRAHAFKLWNTWHLCQLQLQLAVCLPWKYIKVWNVRRKLRNQSSPDVLQTCQTGKLPCKHGNPVPGID